MPRQERIFLSPEEAISAIRIDFSRYLPQPRLFLDLCPLILGADTVVVPDLRQDGLWMSLPSRKPVRKMKKIQFDELGDLLLKVMAGHPPEPDMLAEICSRVFRTPARAERDTGGRPGVWIETEMGSFKCRQCGQCCRQLDYRHELTEADYRQWISLGRRDILDWVGVIHQSSRPPSYAIWMKPGTLEYAPVCPWLNPMTAAGKPAYECAIHEAKPEICRQYPGTRKHAHMTGCPGFAS